MDKRVAAIFVRCTADTEMKAQTPNAPPTPSRKGSNSELITPNRHAAATTPLLDRRCDDVIPTKLPPKKMLVYVFAVSVPAV